MVLGNAHIGKRTTADYLLIGFGASKQQDIGARVHKDTKDIVKIIKRN
jgi:hypothetical protein